MNKKTILIIIGLLAMAASIAMKVLSRDSHLTEFADYWWIPLPIALLCFIGAGTGKKAN